MPGWYRLPAELVDEVLGRLATKDLCSTLLVSRRVHRITTKHLYREVSLDIDYAISPTEGEDLLLFLRTLVARPKLGSYVRYLQLGNVLRGYKAFRYKGMMRYEGNYLHEHILGVNDDAFCYRCVTEIRLGEDLRLIDAAASRFGLSTQMLYETGGLGMFVLTMFHLPSLREINSRNTSNIAGAMTLLAKWNLMERYPKLPSTLVMIHFRRADFHDILALLSITSVRECIAHINGPQLDEDANEDPGELGDPSFFSPSSSSVINLELSSARAPIPPQYLHTILSIPSTLKYFSYCHSPNGWEPGTHHAWSGDIALQALQLQARTLEKVSLLNESVCRHIQAIPSLISLSSLLRLCVSWDLITGTSLDEELPRPCLLTEILPPSLKGLEVHLNRQWCLASLMEVTSFPGAWTPGRRLPRLTEFKLGVYHVMNRYDNPEDQEDWVQRTTAFETAGIALFSLGMLPL